MAWSSGQRRSLSLQGSADRIPVVPFLFVNVPSANWSEEMRSQEQVVHLARRKAGAATKRKDRQALQEWIQEVVRFVSKKDDEMVSAEQGLTWREKL